MWNRGIPKYLLIFYTMDNVEIGNFTPTIQNSMPFGTKEDAERYLKNFLSITYGNNKHILYAIIPALEE